MLDCDFDERKLLDCEPGNDVATINLKEPPYSLKYIKYTCTVAICFVFDNSLSGDLINFIIYCIPEPWINTGITQRGLN